MKKDYLLVAKNPRGTWKIWSVHRPFSMPEPEVQILADQDGWAVKAVHHIYCWQPGLLQVRLHAFWAVQCASHVPEVNAELPQGAESIILPHLPWWYNCLLTDSWGTSPLLMHFIFDQFREQNLILKPSKCDYFRNEITFLAHLSLERQSLPQATQT